MEITKLIDFYGDDIFALALVTTKDYSAAKEVFVKTMSEYESFADDCDLIDCISVAFRYLRDADCNDSAVTLSEVELDSKRQAIFEIVLQKSFMVRACIHLCYENDLDVPQISQVTGESEKYINKVLNGLLPELSEALDKHYKEICTKISADDKLKAYVIRSVTENSDRTFEVRSDAVPTHTWTKKQKLVVIIVAVVVIAIVTIVMPLFSSYLKMEEELRDYSYDEVATDEIFGYTNEANSANTES